MGDTFMTEHTTKTNRHTTFYLAAGPKDGPLIIFFMDGPSFRLAGVISCLRSRPWVFVQLRRRVDRAKPSRCASTAHKVGIIRTIQGN